MSSSPTPSKMSNQKKLALLLSMTRGQRHLYLVAVIALIVASLLIYVPPMIVSVTVNSALGSQQQDSPMQLMLLGLLGGAEYLRDHLWIAAVAIPLVALSGAMFTFVKMRLGALAAERITKSLRDRLYDHLQHLPLTFHSKSQTGDLVQRCSSDVETTRLFFTEQMLEIGRASILLLTAIPLMFSVDWVMALVAISLLPIIVSFAVIFFTRVAGTFKAMDEAEGSLTTVIQENLTGIRVVRAFARQDFENKKFDERNNDHRVKHWKLYKVLAVYWTSSDFMCFTQIVLVLMVGAYRVSVGHMQSGSLVMFIMFVNTYLWPIRHMGRIVSELGKTTVSIERIQEILAEKREDESELTPVKGVSGEIVFDSVNFKHGESEVLHDISFTAPAGSTLALLGPSGSGKSTIIQLLLRFYDPVSGSIRIDGRDISTINRKSARELVSIVMQEPFLFSKSIRDNIKLGRHDASDEDMFAATRIASIDSSIASFEKQYDTLVGERGVTLSGGQRQRVAIARAILRNSPILVLDDALSAVDTHTESMILDALRNRRGKHTTILIAHRLSTLMHADQILVLDHGRIVQRGTHESLVNIDGMYRKLWQIQSALEDDLRAETEVREAVMK